MTRTRLACAYARTRSQSGLTLVEVLVAAMLVAVIAVGTFTAFDAAGRSSADTRAHAQATQLAGQEQERLRGLTTTQVAQLGSVETNRAESGACLEKVGSKWYSKKQATASFFCEKATGGAEYTGTVFTVTSSSRYVTAAKGAEKAAFTCEKTGGAANYLQTTSSVTWPSLGTRAPVSQSSIITAPASGVLLIKVVNQNGQPVEGATVTVAGTPLNATAITPAAGCVTFGGLSAGTVSVTASKVGWIDPQGKSSATKPSVPVTANSVAEITLKLAQPGSIVAEFESNGSTVGVTSDTFYALQTEIESPNNFVGGVAGTPVATAALEKLFPFAKAGTPEAYTVFAGDCEANKPSTASGGAVTDPKANVEPNGTGLPAVKLEVPAVNLTVYEGAKAPSTALEGAEYAYITNLKCSAATAQNYAKVPYQHKVAISTGAGALKGHLVPKYQPYAKELELCVTAKVSGKYVRNTWIVANTKKAGVSPELSLYLKSGAFTENGTQGKLKCP